MMKWVLALALLALAARDFVKEHRFQDGEIISDEDPGERDFSLLRRRCPCC